MPKIRSVHQIEITSRCNLRCRYCPSPNLQRPKMDMSMDTFLAAMDLIRYFISKNTQHSELNLAGIGESTIHPDFLDYVQIARDTYPWGDLVLATNGVAFTEEMALALRSMRVGVYVSLHRPERAGPAIELCRKYDLLRGVSADPSINSVDWAGQVKWHVSTNMKKAKCYWVKNGWVMVMADGRLTTCSFDASGVGVVGTVKDRDCEVKPYELCSKCHLDVGGPYDNAPTGPD